jgi:hypothetical protein
VISPSAFVTQRLFFLNRWRQFQNCDKTIRYCSEVLPPERADRIVIGMRVTRQVPCSNVPVGGPFNATRREDAVRIAIDE